MTSESPRLHGSTGPPPSRVADHLDGLSVQLSRMAADIRDGSLSWGAGSQERHKVLRAAKEVIELIRQPHEIFAEWLSVLTPMAATRLFIEWRVFENIPVDDTISYAHLASKVDVQQSLLVRLAWNLLPAGILKQVGEDRITHTPKSQLYMTRNPITGMICHMFDNSIPSLMYLPKFFETYGRIEPTDRLNTVSAISHGLPGKTVWEIMTETGTMANFALAMSVEKGASWPNLGSYDMSWAVKSGAMKENRDRAILVDVGGGRGHAVKAILEATPGLDPARCVLEDIPEIIDTAKASAGPVIAGIQFVATDFHAEQPVQGAFVYYIRRCLHDYGDDDCVNILTRLADAMKSDSRLLIVEAVQSNPPSTFAAAMDMLMISIGGKERTLEGFRSITSRAGLEILEVYTQPGVEGAVIECAKKGA
ncbi:S-adenosyl-L-methionine-dependent methyltransferase [Rhypophila decipiens]